MRKINTGIGDFFIRHDHDQHVIQEVIEEDQYRRWGDITIKEGDIVVDLGAHIGSFTRLALAMGASVYSYEPDPENYDMLVRNAELSPRLGAGVLHRLAVSSRKGGLILFKDPERPELNTLVKEENGNTIHVQSTTLDDIILQYGKPHIDLLKLDVEGAEYEILYNSKYLLHINQITMEWHYGSTRMSELIIFLEQKGFKTVWLGGNGDFGHLQLKRI